MVMQAKVYEVPSMRSERGRFLTAAERDAVKETGTLPPRYMTQDETDALYRRLLAADLAANNQEKETDR